jgi:cytoskeletal protein CcmA (bactofilin family)
MFSSGKGKGPATAKQGGRSGSGGLSFISPDVVVSGDLATESQIHIDGRVDGNVTCATLIQGKGGTIAGNIIAESACIAGLVDGTVNARLVTLEPSARVTGDVTYETLSIAAGAAIDGRLARREGAGPGTVMATLKALPDRSKPRGDQPSLLPPGEPLIQAAE